MIMPDGFRRKRLAARFTPERLAKLQAEMIAKRLRRGLINRLAADRAAQGIFFYAAIARRLCNAGFPFGQKRPEIKLRNIHVLPP